MICVQVDYFDDRAFLFLVSSEGRMKRAVLVSDKFVR